MFEREPEVEPGLLELENVVLIPHLGSATIETRTAMGVLAARNVVAVLARRAAAHADHCINRCQAPLFSEGGGHRRHVRGRRAAAAADQLDPEGAHAAGVVGHLGG